MAWGLQCSLPRIFWLCLGGQLCKMCIQGGNVTATCARGHIPKCQIVKGGSTQPPEPAKWTPHTPCVVGEPPGPLGWALASTCVLHTQCKTSSQHPGIEPLTRHPGRHIQAKPTIWPDSACAEMGGGGSGAQGSGWLVAPPTQAPQHLAQNLAQSPSPRHVGPLLNPHSHPKPGPTNHMVELRMTNANEMSSTKPCRCHICTPHP